MSDIVEGTMHLGGKKSQLNVFIPPPPCLFIYFNLAPWKPAASIVIVVSL